MGNLQPKVDIQNSNSATADALGLPKLEARLNSDIFLPAVTQGNSFTRSGRELFWSRVYARLMDTTLFTLLGSFMFGFSSSFFGQGISQSINVDGFFFALICANLATFVVEPIWMSIIGNTPGKSLLCLEVQMKDGSKPSFGTLVRRNFQLLMRGCGFHIPIFKLIAFFFFRRKVNRAEEAGWDRSADTQIRFNPISQTRYHSTLWAIGICYFVIVVLEKILVASGH